MEDESCERSEEEEGDPVLWRVTDGPTIPLQNQMADPSPPSQQWVTTTTPASPRSPADMAGGEVSSEEEEEELLSRQGLRSMAGAMSKAATFHPRPNP